MRRVEPSSLGTPKRPLTARGERVKSSISAETIRRISLTYSIREAWSRGLGGALSLASSAGDLSRPSIEE